MNGAESVTKVHIHTLTAHTKKKRPASNAEHSGAHTTYSSTQKQNNKIARHFHSVIGDDIANDFRRRKRAGGNRSGDKGRGKRTKCIQRIHTSRKYDNLIKSTQHTHTHTNCRRRQRKYAQNIRYTLFKH